jgi:uncharacterized protein (DUF58 family)
LFTKKFEEETNLRTFIVMDTSSSMLFPYKEKDIHNKLYFSVFCAAALIYLLRKQRDAVGLVLFSGEVELITAARISLLHARMLYARLNELISPSFAGLKRTTSAAKALHHLAENIHKRSLVIIFSDMLDSGDSSELFAALQHLRYKKHEVILFHVRDKKREELLEYVNRPYRFVDMETGQELKLNPNEVRDIYTKSVADFNNQVRLHCGQYNIDLIETDINKDFAEVLLPYLIKRGKLY